MPAKVVTLRSELKRSISDFLADADMTCAATEEALVSLAVALADYREEDRPLFPRILICDDLDAVLANVQGSGPVEIGSALRQPGTISRALKKCAPLTAGAWAIWVERQPETFRYGVFREPLPTALDIRATLLDTPPSDALRAILIAQFAAGTIELVSAGRPGIRIHLSGQREDDLAAEDTQQKVADWSARDIGDERARASYRNFATTALQDLLRKGHGTLIAVVPCGSRAWRRNAKDAVKLDEPIDLSRQLEHLSDEATSLALFELSTSIELVAGMLSSDGITVFDTRGRVLAFNWFIRTDTRNLSARESLGGARHRAFSALSALVDKGQIVGCFIRSSDGTDRAYGEEV
ncbi:hypothetical protein [Mycolicibacterium pulveris]|uniref:hypothetical protein n=1 Tax=Mycolicibacterium pulveris TaxID=36813 RepID=UPI003CF5C8B2